MSEEIARNSTRRSFIRTAAGAAVAGVGATGLASASFHEVQVTAKIYVNRPLNDGATVSDGLYVSDVLQEDLVDQFLDLGLNLDVEYMGHITEQLTLDDFIDNVRDSSTEDGYAIHVWVNDKDDGGSNTPGHLVVNGDGQDAYTDLQIDSIDQSDAYNRNIILHEVVHGFLNDERDDFACPEHEPGVPDDEDGFDNTSEHTCGRVERNGLLSYEVSPMATSYHDDSSNFGDTCNGNSGWSFWLANYSFTQELSECTKRSVENLRDAALVDAAPRHP